MPLQGTPTSGVQNGLVNRKRNSKTSHSRRIVESDDDEMGMPSNIDFRPSSARPRRSSVKCDPEAVDSFLSALSSDDEDHAKEKRPHLGFLPALSSDDDDLDNPVPVDIATGQTKGKGKVRVFELSSDDFDPSAEPAEANGDGMDFIIDETPIKGNRKGKGKAVSSTQRKAVERQAVLRSYDIDERIPMVMLISLKAGALGLQLTAANNVYLVCPDNMALVSSVVRLLIIPVDGSVSTLIPNFQTCRLLVDM